MKTLPFPLLPGTSAVAASPSRGVHTHSQTLSRGQVQRIEKADGVAGIRVTRGVLWLTHSPANEDVFLRASTSHTLSAGWPVVIEALEDAAIRFIHRS